MNKFKLIVGLVATVAVIYFVDRGVSYFKGVLTEKDRLHTELIGQTEKYQQLSQYAAKLEIQYSDQSKMQAELEKKFLAEKNELKGRIEILSNATFLIRDRARDSKNSDVVYQGDKVKYVLNEIRFDGGPPVGYVLIFDDGRVVSKLYNHLIQVNTAVSRNEDSGKYTIVSKADYILKSPSIKIDGKEPWFNKAYPLKIVGGTVFIDPTEKNQLIPHFMLWAPHANGGVSVGVVSAGSFIRPTVDFSVSGFGVTRNDLDWKFIQLGLDINTDLTDLGVHLTPFSYRFWPSVLTNTFIGPAVGYTKSGPNLQLNLNLTF